MSEVHEASELAIAAHSGQEMESGMGMRFHPSAARSNQADADVRATTTAERLQREHMIE